MNGTSPSIPQPTPDRCVWLKPRIVSLPWVEAEVVAVVGAHLDHPERQRRAGERVALVRRAGERVDETGGVR
jgi:hypothetical protein